MDKLKSLCSLSTAEAEDAIRRRASHTWVAEVADQLKQIVDIGFSISIDIGRAVVSAAEITVFT